jgi:zinc transport system substrate-binding protein
MPESSFKRPSDKIVFFIALAAIIGAAAFVFLHKSPASPGTAEKPALKIAATVVPVESLIREIGGDKVDVRLIVPAGQSPHTFEPTPDAINSISGAKEVFTIGVIDEWVSPLSGMLGVPEFYIGEGVNLRPIAETFTVGEEEEGEGEYDPHYWLSISNGKIMAQNIAGELSRLDAENEGFYEENLKAFLGRADAADARIREILSNLENRKIITFHDAWGYFAADYGLEVVAVYQPSPGKEPSPGDIKMLLDKAKESGIKVFFSEVTMSSAPLKAIGESEGVRVVPLNPIETQGNYLETLIRDAETIRDASR